MSKCTTDIRYVPGADNVVADAISRAPPQESGTVTSMEAGVDTEVIDYGATYKDVDEQLIVDMSTAKPPSVASGFLDTPNFRYQSRLGTRCSDRCVIASSGMVYPEMLLDPYMQSVSALEDVATRCGAINTSRDARQASTELVPCGHHKVSLIC